MWRIRLGYGLFQEILTQAISFFINNDKIYENSERIKNFKEARNPILVCSEDQRFLVAEQMREINIVHYQFF